MVQGEEVAVVVVDVEVEGELVFSSSLQYQMRPSHLLHLQTLVPSPSCQAHQMDRLLQWKFVIQEVISSGCRNIRW